MTGDPERVMRVMKYAFLVSVVLFIFVTAWVPSKAAHPPAQIVELVVAVVAVTNIGLGFGARPFLARMAKANQERAGTASPLNQWFSANIVSLAMIESCGLFAFVLHLLGSSTRVAGLLFGCALLALLVWTPGKPPTAQDASGISR